MKVRSDLTKKNSRPGQPVLLCKYKRKQKTRVQVFENNLVDQLAMKIQQDDEDQLIIGQINMRFHPEKRNILAQTVSWEGAGGRWASVELIYVNLLSNGNK